MNFFDLNDVKEIWAVDDGGEVVFDNSQQWIEDEFPTQLHVRLYRVGTTLHLAVDNMDTIAEIKGSPYPDICVIAFSKMVNAIINMTE